jgi:hypothetical protein
LRTDIYISFVADTVIYVHLGTAISANTAKILNGGSTGPSFADALKLQRGNKGVAIYWAMYGGLYKYICPSEAMLARVWEMVRVV